MVNSNNDLIEKVFEALRKYRPALDRMLVHDDDFDEGPDPRMLGDQIIKSFPWPIGVEVRRLLSGSCRNIDRLRLDQLFKTAERSMQFTGFVLLSQIFDLAQTGALQVSPGFKGQFAQRIGALSLGNMVWLIRQSMQELKNAGIDPFVQELSEVLDKEMLAAMEAWVPLRNAISHYQVNMPPVEIEKKCIESEELLIKLLSALACLANYKLISIRQIQVIKLRHSDPKYLHVIDLLNNSDSDFRGRNIEENIHTDSNAVILTKNLKDLRNYLNLSPLVIDTHGEVINTREKFNLRKDVFLYSKFRGDNIMYVGTESTETCDLRNLSSYPDLLEEFKTMHRLLT